MLEKEIEKIRKKMHKAIEKYGINSKEATKYSKQIDELINKMKHNREIRDIEMLGYYDSSYEMLKKLTQESGIFPTIPEWNYFAKNNNFLSHISIEYISECKWNILEVKITREVQIEKYKKN